jgi:2,3-bisphosphoglycerate-dependent phosphoglycerate mutase
MTGLTRLILVRHGETAWNNSARFQGHLDSPLTETGVQQAKSLGARLARERIAALYSSDLGRALHTARCIAEHTGHSIQPDTRLRERGLGIFEGRDKSQITQLYPAEAERYYSRDPHFVVPGGESAQGHFEKAFAALTDIVARHKGETAVAVTHGGLVSSTFRYVAGIDLGAERRYSLKNAAYNCFTFDAGHWTVETWGDTSHFPAALRGTGASFVETSPDENPGFRS